MREKRRNVCSSCGGRHFIGRLTEHGEAYSSTIVNYTCFGNLSRARKKASIASKSAHAQKQQRTRTKRHRDDLTKHVLVAPKTVSLNPRSHQLGPGTRAQPPVSARAGHMRARVLGTGSGPGWAE
eukprot:scaffold8721_cov80-Phaeocystis_antarctica.AAC.5